VNADKLETILDTLVGPREDFRRILLDAPGILERMCRMAKSESQYGRRKRGYEPWKYISDWTGHGSGVSKAIYELYRPKEPTP
jgi:hypothetical protein